MSHIDIKSLKGITQDNREVKEGYLFAALQGEHADGRDYIDDAINNGASVILSDKSVQAKSTAKFELVENPRKELSYIAAEFYKNQPDNAVAITGSNGKSSVAHFVNQLWHAIGREGAFIGTLSGTMTTPDPVFLHGLLAQMSEDGVANVAIEASSHGLEQYRIDGVKIDVAAFTSFSQDHLDYHDSMEDYMSAKSRLFSEVLQKDGVAVLNADIPEYKILAKICEARGLRILSYGENGADITLVSVSISGVSQHIKINVMGKDYSVALPLVGQFQAMNALCALACVVAKCPEKVEELVVALEKLDPVPGRLQHVENNIYVDYAHTPDALENVLNALRPHCAGKLICVFGCGGDRDRTKRKLMGGIAENLSDVVIVTDDNPRSEVPANIRAEILSGISNDSNIHEIGERREAIGFAIDLMDNKDILLVAGKGHEQGQAFDNGRVEPFDDVVEVNNLLSKLCKYKENLHD